MPTLLAREAAHPNTILLDVRELTERTDVLGLPWQKLAADYDVTHGGLLPFGLTVLALSPLIAARVHNRRGECQGE